MMDTQLRNQIREQVMAYVKSQDGPADVRPLVETVRSHFNAGTPVREVDVMDVVRPMVLSGALQFASGLKVQLGERSPK